MLRPLQITGTTQFQVRFRYFKAVIGAHHYFQPFPRVFGQFVVRHKDTIRLFSATSHPTAQLMELRKSEAFGILNDHHRSIGHIHPNFDHGSGNHNLSLSGNKELHLLIFLRRLHLAVNFGNGTAGKLFQDMLVTFFQVLEVDLLAFLY